MGALTSYFALQFLQRTGIGLEHPQRSDWQPTKGHLSGRLHMTRILDNSTKNRLCYRLAQLKYALVRGTNRGVGPSLLGRQLRNGRADSYASAREATIETET